MSLEQVHTALRPQRLSYPDTRLPGRWLTITRIAWSVMVLLMLALFIGSLPESFVTFHTSCPSLSCDGIVGQLTARDVQALQKLGLSYDAYAYYWTVLSAVIGLIWCIVGGLLAWRKSNDWLVLLVALMLISVGVGSTTDNLLFTSSIWRIPEYSFYAIKALIMLYTFALFPNGRFAPRWIGWIPLLYPANLVCYLVFLRQLHLPGWSLYRSPLNALTWFGCEAILVLAQIYRYARVSNQVERQQTKWVAFSFLLILLADLGSTAVSNLVSIQQIGLLYVFILTLFTCMFLAVPLSIAIAILRYRLWDIDIIINRALVYGLLTVCIISIYIFVVGYLGVLFRSGGNLIISLMAAGLVAVLFQPLRELLQRGANRLLYGQRDEPYAVIRRLSQRLEATLTPDTILSTIVETVAQALKLPYTAIMLQEDSALSVAASYGNQPAETLSFPLVYQRETIGKLLLAPRTPGETFTPADILLLNELTHQIALAAHAVRLASDLRSSNEHLQAARERLVATREEERRLRRDLHDGLGPTLAALTLKIGAARKLLSRDPAKVETLLLELNGEIESTVSDIRRLVYNLRPPSLDDVGLLGAIREHIEQHTTFREEDQANALRIIFSAPDQLPPLSAAVEVATYRIVQEALTNVVRHAHAHTCRICLALDDMLTIEISDDGVGISTARTSGVGIHSMLERAAEIGGTCLIEPCAIGGTRVLCRLPLVKEQ